MGRFLLAARVFCFLYEELLGDPRHCSYRFSLSACQRVFARRAGLDIDENLLDLVANIQLEIRTTLNFLEANPQLIRKTKVEIAPVVGSVLPDPNPESPNFGGEMRNWKRQISFVRKFFGAFASGKITEEMLKEPVENAAK
ncbi:MAG: hypothetical protein G01um101438_1027 [Parcubacteria group bacterium Gr01-1014_38]|nr:MAG: hypothetical protein G01um101438_1027 [Parcubacteria group bacterium Gr01-1014_38]